MCAHSSAVNDRKFVAILNEELDERGLDWGNPPEPSNPEGVAAWAAFLARCVGRGISVADPRWRRLEIRRRAGVPRFHLPPGAAPPKRADDDFKVGLALLVSLMGRDPTADS